MASVCCPVCIIPCLLHAESLDFLPASQMQLFVGLQVPLSLRPGADCHARNRWGYLTRKVRQTGIFKGLSVHAKRGAYDHAKAGQRAGGQRSGWGCAEGRAGYVEQVRISQVVGRVCDVFV